MTRSNRDLSKTRDNYVCTEVGDIEKICKCVNKRLHVFAFPGIKPAKIFGDYKRARLSRKEKEKNDFMKLQSYKLI